ncbi:phosphate-starvation-inducible PsiE family protein [Prochlorothrix hollandica]|uniref:Membrane protein n=1 Tax=Prochlorothrix hollandica PCC 9006 = CALU 1027 TaxID=317619 RepID=A0A0M2PWC9_PROHO|nr:phosphate-starvation-inducible PsiE family protein [Prochlorothrix hollandica]KKI98681.1 membrane protein [Prochlorothrix hollandica PCC 9006 = CALU 1027]
MSSHRKLYTLFRKLNSDQSFLHLMEGFETIVAKLLSLGMVVVISISIWDLAIILSQTFLADASLLLSQKTVVTITTAKEFFTKTLIEILGVFLSILIALEVLENITAYLRRHVIQLELVIATSLTAVARKIIILDLDKVTGIDLIGLAVAIFALSISYLIVRQSHHDS